MGSQIKSHISRISQVREEEDEVDPLGKEEVALEVTEVRVGRNLKANLEVQEVDSPVEEDSRGEGLIKSPTTKRPRVSDKAEDKDKDRCYHCHQQGHFAAECPEKSKGQAPTSSEGKKFEDYTYAYSGAEEPQLATATVLPQAYEDALAAMRQSLKNQDPLHSLNM